MATTSMPTLQHSEQQHPHQQQQTLLVARSFLRHSVSAVCRSRLGRAACASASASCSERSAAKEVAGGDDDAMPERLDRCCCFRPARFGDVPNPLLVASAPAAAEAALDDANDANDAAAAEEDGMAAIASKLSDWLEGGSAAPSGRHRHHRQQRGGGILDQLLSSRPGRSGGGGHDDGSAGGADGGGGGGLTAAAATLVVATWIRGTGEDYDDEGERYEEDDQKDDTYNEEEHRPADGVVLERVRFSLRPKPTPPPTSTLSSSASASSSSSSASPHYFAQLRSALRSLQAYCDGADSRTMVDPADGADYEAVGRGFTFVVEEEEEVGGDEEDKEEMEEVGEGGNDENACGLFAKSSRRNPLDDHHARTLLCDRRQGRWAPTNGSGGAGAGTCMDSSSEDKEVGEWGSSTRMTTDDSQNRADTDASNLLGGGTATATTNMMMAQQSQSLSHSLSQTSRWTEHTADGTDGQGATGNDGQSQMMQSRPTEAKDGERHTHSHTQYSDESSDDDDDADDDGNDGVDRYNLGSIDLGDRQLSVSVERSIYAPDSPVVRLLFGGDDNDGAEYYEEEEESATSQSQSQRQYGDDDDDDDMFSVTTTLPSQGAMGYSSYRHMQPMMNAHPSHDANLGELKEGLDEASNGSMVTPPPPMSTVQIRINNDAQMADVNDSMESTQPSQNTGFSTQQSSITEGASQRSRRRKGSKKKQSARAKANAEVSKIMGVRRRDCIPRSRKSKSPPALTPMPPAGNAARSTGKRPALASALRNGGGGGGGGKRPALSNAANNRSTRFSPLPKVGSGGGNTPMRRGVGPSSRSPAISSTSTVLVGSAANNTPVPAGGASGRSPAISGASTATVLMSRYGSVSEAETVLMSRTPTPPRKGMGRQG